VEAAAIAGAEDDAFAALLDLAEVDHDVGHGQLARGGGGVGPEQQVAGFEGVEFLAAEAGGGGGEVQLGFLVHPLAHLVGLTRHVLQPLKMQHVIDRARAVHAAFARLAGAVEIAELQMRERQAALHQALNLLGVLFKTTDVLDADRGNHRRRHDGDGWRFVRGVAQTGRWGRGCRLGRGGFLGGSSGLGRLFPLGGSRGGLQR